MKPSLNSTLVSVWRQVLVETDPRYENKDALGTSANLGLRRASPI
jgi:hypothetical protein